VEHRVALPTLSAWGADGEPLRLIQSVRWQRKTLRAEGHKSCYGLYLPELDETWLCASSMGGR